MMRVAGIPVLVLAVAVLGLVGAHFPGSFHNIMMMIGKKNGTKRLSWKGPTKMARIAPSPPRMWALIDPPGSLGDLGDEGINSNRIARSLKSLDKGAYENEESSSPNRVVRSVSNRREARQEDGDDVTEAPEDVTEAPEDVTEAPEDVTEPPEEEEPTEPPVTEPPTPAPVICGGDLSVVIDPHNPPQPDAQGRMFHEDIISPGFEDGAYPDQDFTCEWTIAVGKECQMGMLMFSINEGEIRETSRCEEDHLAVSYRGGQANKFCGILKQGDHQVTGSDIWTSANDEPSMKLTFKASERPLAFLRNSGKPVGFNMTLSAYCWYWTPEFLAQTTSSTSTTSTTTTTTTTEAPADEPVTTISEDGQGYEDEEDTATEAPQDGFEESGERFSDISNDLENINGLSDSPFIPELASVSSVGSLSDISSLIAADTAPEEDSNTLDQETPNIDVVNTVGLNPIVAEAGLLPLALVQSDSPPIAPVQNDSAPIISVQTDPPPIDSSELALASQNGESNLNTNSEEESTLNSDNSSLEIIDSKVSEPEEPIPVNNKPVPVDSNAQVNKPKPNNSDKLSSPNKPNKPNNKPNKKPNKHKPTKPSEGNFIPIAPLRDDANLMEGDTPYIGEKINFEPIINQLLAQ